MADNEDTRLAELRDLKRRRLHELDKRIAVSGMDAPPDVQIERAELARELGIVEKAMSAPSAAFVEELGGSGRFGAYYAETKRANDGIALLGERLDAFIADSQEWRAMHRQWIVLIGVALIILLIIVVAIVTWLAARGAV